MWIDEFVGDVERAGRELHVLPASTYAPTASDANESSTAEVVYEDVGIERFGGEKEWEWNQRLVWR
jgi:hypothetical protein